MKGLYNPSRVGDREAIPNEWRILDPFNFFHAELPFPLRYNTYDVTFLVYIVYFSKIHKGLKITVEDWKILHGFFIT